MQVNATVAELYELYLELHAKPFTKSWKNTEEYWRRYIADQWGNRSAADLPRLELQRWVIHLADRSGKPTATRAYTVLAAVMNWADRNGYLEKNPCRGIRVFAPEYRDRFLQPEELQAFFTALDSLQTDMKDVFLLCLTTGARKSNILAMRWADVRIEQALWQIQQGHLKWPKNAWRKLLEKSGLSNLRIHDLRRTVGSYMAINGASPYIIGAALGHKDPRSTAIYARLNVQPVREAFERVERDIFDRSMITSTEALSPATESATEPSNLSKLTPADIIRAEGRILLLLHEGLSAKGQLQRRIGFRLTASELSCILEDLLDRDLIERFKRPGSSGHWCYTLKHQMKSASRASLRG